MTWILSGPSGFGAYFPDAEFVDDNEKMRAEFERTETIEEGVHPDKAFGDFCRKNRYNPRLMKVPAQEYQKPSRFVLNRKEKDYADLISAGNQRVLVSAAVMETIERLEPEVHQFWPVEFLDKRGKPVNEKSYFGMTVLQWREGLRPELCEASVRTMHSYALHWHLNAHKKALIEAVAIEAQAVAGAHLWWDERLLGNHFFVSDELSAALRAQDLKLWPKFYECTSV